MYNISEIKTIKVVLGKKTSYPNCVCVTLVPCHNFPTIFNQELNNDLVLNVVYILCFVHV